jgi:hypothetical protein
MTTEGLAGRLEGGTSNLTVGQVLSVCDRIVEEPGRRRHMFTWLRAPGAQAEDWLAVDAYYPANRLVVVWHERPSPDDRLYVELVPKHGLRLLELAPDRLDGEPEAALRRMIDALGLPPRRARQEPAPHPAAAPAQPAAPRQVSDSVSVGVLEGLALAVVLFIEMYVGVVQAGVDAGRPVLAFGLALDACARALGTIAASRVGTPDWAWGCALGGSPFVAVFALFRRDGPVAVEPAPLGGRLAIVALAALAIAVLTGS